MNALPRHFDRFFGNLNPAFSFESQASSHYAGIKALIEDLSGTASILRPVCFLQGSYRQHTAIHAINDVDIVVLCRALSFPPPMPSLASLLAGPALRLSWSRDEIFNTIASPLRRDRRYAMRVRYGPGSMCIKVDLGIKVEILPVVMREGAPGEASEPFYLHRPETRRWEIGYARDHQAKLSWKNGRTSGNFIPTIKVLKHLRSIHGLNTVSFHIESLLFSFPDALFVGGWAEVISNVLRYMSSYTAPTWWAVPIRTPCGDRQLFSIAEWNLPQWFAFHTAARRWSQIADRAVSAPREVQSIAVWRALLGAAYFPTTAS